MIITHSQIEETSVQLKVAIEKREEALKSTIALLTSLSDIDKFLEEFHSSIKKAKAEVGNEDREIRNLWKKFYELKSVSKIVADDPKYERQLIIFVELQSIASEPPFQLNRTIENVTNHLDKLKDFLNGKLNECVFNNNEEKKHLKNLSKDNEKDNVEVNNINKMCKEDHSTKKNDLYNSNKFLKKAVSTKLNKLYIAEYKESTSKQKVEPPDLSNQSKFVESEELKEALSMVNKKCTVCKLANPWILTLKCCGYICVNCLKKRIIEMEPKILLNPLEAEKKQASLSACPIHKAILNPKILQIIFGHNELELLSIGALKRLKKHSKKKYPILCADCKGVIEDNSRLIKVCAKHKICDHCYKYSFSSCNVGRERRRMGR